MPQAVKALCRAARQGDVTRVDMILRQVPDVVNERNRDGRSALIVAVRHGQAGVVEHLLRHGAEVNGASHRSGATPVWHCAWKGEQAILRLLLENGGDPTTEATDCGTPLMVACQYGHIECVRLLLDQAPTAAVISGMDESLAAAVPAAASTARGPASPTTTTTTAAVESSSSPPSPSPLPVDIDFAQSNYQCTALWWACRSDREEVVRLLLARGADFTRRDWKGRTPLDIARVKNHHGCHSALEEAHRALALYKYRLLYDAEQCLVRLPLSRTRRGTLHSRASHVPACLRERLVRQQHLQQQQQQVRQWQQGKEGENEGFEGEGMKEGGKKVVFDAMLGGGEAGYLPCVNVKPLRKEEEDYKDDEERERGGKKGCEGRGRKRRQKRGRTGGEENGGSGRLRLEPGKKRKRNMGVNHPHLDHMHHHKGGSAAAGNLRGFGGGRGGRGGEGSGENSLSAVLSSADFTSSSSSCSSSQDESSTPVLDHLPMTRRRGSPMYFKRQQQQQQQKQQQQDDEEFEDENVVLEVDKGQAQKQPLLSSSVKVTTAARVELKQQQRQQQRSFDEEATVMVSRFVLNDLPEELFVELMCLMR
ncbi:hypothetical protein VYU27_001747 [Nannochloropsis oceanica]